MSDDPINFLASVLIAESVLPTELDVIIIALDAGITLVHNPHAWTVRDGTDRIKPAHTIVRLNNSTVGFVNPWRWEFIIDEDRIRYALHRALNRTREGLPLNASA